MKKRGIEGEEGGDAFQSEVLEDFMNPLNWLKRKAPPRPTTPPISREAPIDLTEIHGAVKEIEGLSQLVAEPIDAWIRGNVDVGCRSAAWTEAAAQWLGRLKRRLGEGYALYESSNFLALSATNPDQIRQLLGYAEEVFRGLLTLRGEAPKGHGGKLAILHTRDLECYYDYISRLYPDEGEFATSSGMFVRDGYWHVVLPGPDVASSTVTHELSHAIVSDLELPGWLDEGIAQMMEGMDDCRHMDKYARGEIYGDMRLWVARGLSEFWSGESFFHPELQRASYLLARVLVRNLVQDCGDAFPEFLINASRKDSGRSAAKHLLGIDLDLYTQRQVSH